jgi:hypothetical protein
MLQTDSTNYSVFTNASRYWVGRWTSVQAAHFRTILLMHGFFMQARPEV